MEFMERGELFDYIVGKKRMEEEEACKVFEQIISGIEYTHKLRIVHRDLKLENCLIDYDKTIRIVDFGLSNTYKPDERLRTACGSPCYAAPEMIDGKAPYEPIMVDVWSAGVILFAMVCGFLPFEDKDTPKLYRKILNGEYSISGHVSLELQDFISKVLTVDPAKRIRIEDMKKHAWWKKYSDNYYPEGLIVGYHKIPIEAVVLKEIKALGIDADLTEKSLETNLHNNLTTTYYILLKKCLREGTISKNHYHDLDKFAVESNERRSKSTQPFIADNLKAADILKMISTPNEKQRSKSYYLGSQNFGKRKTDDINSLGSHSVRIEQKRKSASKFKKDKNQSLEKDRSYNNSKYFKPAAKSSKKVPPPIT
jgi:5'-AMP-activated protein kinase, catalytic alpha subunit